MAEWTNIWVHGLEPALSAWIESKKISDTDGASVLPHEIFVSGPVMPMVQDGVDDEGLPKYKPKNGGAPQMGIWLFSLYGTKADLIDEIKVLNGPYTIHENTTIEEMRELYPEHAIATIPYIT